MKQLIVTETIPVAPSAPRRFKAEKAPIRGFASRLRTFPNREKILIGLCALLWMLLAGRRLFSRGGVRKRRITASSSSAIPTFPGRISRPRRR